MLAELIAQRDALQAQIAAAQKAEKTQRIQEVREMLARYGITADELGSKPKRTVSPKYALEGNTWTGRGRQPVWLRDAIAAGHTL
ncbi:MAG TPA: H-NS histone family protein, partial [Burkholderiaceae bacterium]|nr:H-NS histone family protein [Burkholderiaceae bacterium]